MSDQDKAIEEAISSTDDKYDVSKKMSVFMLVVLGLLYMINMADQQVVAVVLELIKKDLGLTDAQAGALPAILLFSTSILAIPCAMVVDRWSRRKGIAIMAIVWSIAHFATGMGTRFVHIAVARFFTGFGEAGYVPGSTTWLSFVFPKEIRARVLGFFSACAPLGVTLGVIIGGAMAQASGSWRTPFYVFAIPGVIVGIVVWFLPDYKTVKSTEEKKGIGEYFSDVASLFRIKTLPVHWLATIFAFILIYGFITWLPTMLMRAYEIDVGKAGALTGLTVLVGLISAPVGGALADRWQKRSDRGRLYFASLGFLIATVTHTAVYLSMGTSLTLTMIFATLNGIIMPMLIPLFFTVNADVTPPRLRATSAGVQILIVVMFGGAWAPVVMGALSDAMGGGISGLVRAGLILVISSPCAAIFYYIASRFYPEDSKRVTDEVMAATGE